MWWEKGRRMDIGEGGKKSLGGYYEVLGVRGYREEDYMGL